MMRPYILKHSEAFTGIALNVIAAVTEIIIILSRRPIFKPMNIR
jgi:hypothetical protein